MRMLFASLLLAGTQFNPACAAEFLPLSHIASVIVFPQGADVTREIEVDLPAGEHSVILSDLPQTIDTQSIRVEGVASEGLAVGSVDTRNKFQGEATSDTKRAALEKQILDLSFERQALDLTIADLNQQRTILVNLADKQLVPQSNTDTVKSIDVAQFGGLLDLVAQKLVDTAKGILAAQKRQRDIDEESAKLSNQLAELSPDQNYRTEVVVNVEAAAALKGKLRINYRVQEAGWSPFFDARLTIGNGQSKPTLDLVHRAEVTQSTGEKWDNVALTLSTSRPNGSTSAPEVVEWEVKKDDVEPVASAAAPSVAEADMELKDDKALGGAMRTRKLELAKPKQVMQTQAVVETAGFQATYAIAGRVSIDNAGQSKRVRITSQQAEATLQAVVSPRFDTTAYLTAAFTVQGQGPQLPGVVNLFRDGIFVGQGTLPLLNPGEEAKLGFGGDDLVKVSRAEVKRVAGEEGLLTSSNVDERAWDITVKNLHSVDLPVRVIDRVPFTASKDIEITEMPTMTPPTVRDLDKKRGVLAWDFVLPEQADNVLKTGYKITWPEGMRVSIAD